MYGAAPDGPPQRTWSATGTGQSWRATTSSCSGRQTDPGRKRVNSAPADELCDPPDQGPGQLTGADLVDRPPSTRACARRCGLGPLRSQSPTQVADGAFVLGFLFLLQLDQMGDGLLDR